MRTQYCTRCGSILEKGAKFCTECGAKVTDATDIKGYGYTSPDDYNVQPAAPVEEPAPAADPVAEPAAPVQQESVPSYYAPSPEAEAASPADTWQKADAFTDAPNAPDPQPETAYWSSQPQNTEGSWQANAGGFQQMTAPAPGTPSSRKGTVLILGIVTLIFSVTFPLVSYICGIVGLVMASKAQKAGENVRNGRLLCIIGLVLAVLNSIVGMIIGVIAAMSDAFTDLFSVFISY